MMRHIMPKGANLVPHRRIEKGMKGMYYDEINEIASNPTLNIKPVGYIFYQPGDLHDPILLKNFLGSLLVRIGDLHHLENPLLKTIDFIDSVSSFTEGIFLNTNPSLLPFFRYLFPICKNMPISEVTIEEDILIEARKLNSSCFASEKRKDIAYIGSTNSPFHPRRSYWVNSLVKDTSNTIHFDIFPSMNPKEWLTTCIKYTSILSPSLNSQWSHNLFAPNLVGTRIFTDCQSHPSYSYYNLARVKTIRSCSYALSLESLKSMISLSYNECNVGHHEIALNACNSLEPAHCTRNRIYSNHNINSRSRRNSLSEKDPEQFIRLVIAANVFEILQEIARIIVTYNTYTVNFQTNALFSELTTYFHHPRITYRQGSKVSAPPENYALMTVEGIKNHLMSTSFLISIKVELAKVCSKSLCFSSRSFDPRNITIYESVQRTLTSIVGNNYQPVPFSQRLLDVVEVDYSYV